MKPVLQIKRADLRKLSDEELIRHYIELHEYVAFNALFERYAHIVYGMCLKQTKNAETALGKMEELFVQMSGDIKTLKTGEFKQWLYDYITGHKNIPYPDTDFTLNTVVPASSIKIMSLEQLSKEERLCIRLFYEGNKSFAEICKATGMRMVRLKEVLHSAKEHIAAELQLNGQLAHIHDHSSCLSAAQMKEYAGNHMESEECHAVEHHLAACELCSGAIDGMQIALVQGGAMLDGINTRFLNDHFSITYPQVHISSFVLDGASVRSRKTKKIPLWVNVALGIVVVAAAVVVLYVEKHKLFNM